MAANPIDDAVVQLRRLADVIRKHGTVPSLSLEHIANTLTAAQQQGQAVACGGCGNADPDKVCIGCLHPFAAPQPAQQGGGDVCEVCDGGPGNDGPCLCGISAPPSAPVGVEGLLADLETIWHSVSDDKETNAAYQRLKAAIAQQPAPSAPVGLDPPVEQQRDMLAQAIRDAAVKAGIARADAGMTGPMLLMLCDDMADCILAQQPAAVDEVEGLKRLVRHLAGNPDFDFVSALATQHKEPTT